MAELHRAALNAQHAGRFGFFQRGRLQADRAREDAIAEEQASLEAAAMAPFAPVGLAAPALLSATRLVPAQAHGWGIADGVQHGVDAPPAALQLAGQLSQVVSVGDVELDDVGWSRQALGDPAGEAQGPAERGEDDVRALFLGQSGERRGDRRLAEHPGDEDLLVAEQHGCGFLDLT